MDRSGSMVSALVRATDQAIMTLLDQQPEVLSWRRRAAALLSPPREPTNIMHGAEVLVPLFGIIFLFGMPVVAFIIHRVLKHQERIEMIRHGMQPQGPADVINAVHGMPGQPWNVKTAPPPPPFSPASQ